MSAMRVRHIVAGAIVAVLLLLLMFGGGAVSEADDTGTLSATPSTISIAVLAGSSQSSPPVSVEIVATQAIPTSTALGASMLGDLVRDDSAARIPRSDIQVTVTRDPADQTNESFVLTFTPSLNGAGAGKYSGSIRVTGPGVTPLTIPVTLTVQGGEWGWVLLILVLGLLVGWLLKWYTDAGSKLSAQTRRFASARRKIGDVPAQNLPKFVLDELADVTEGLNDADQAKAEAALTLLEGQVGGLTAVTDAVANLRASIAVHQSEIAKQGLGVGQLVVNEARRLGDALNESADLAAAKTAITTLLEHAAAIGTCLLAAGDQAHAAVLDLYCQDRFDDALAAFKSPPAAGGAAGAGGVAAGGAAAGGGAAGGGAAGGVAGAAPVGAPGAGAANPTQLQNLVDHANYLQSVLTTPAGSNPPTAPSGVPPVGANAVPAGEGPLARAWRWFLRWLPFFIGILTTGIIALIGLKTQWASDLTFGAGGFIDYVALFLWGVAAFVTGKTLTDFLSTVVSK